MNWWGNSFDKAYGFSNLASNALKKAQKKIDKVLDIPTEEELGISEVKNLSSIKKQDNTSKEKIETDKIEDSEYSDINLKSPEIQISEKNKVIFENYDESVAESKRLGDWYTDDSMTASQFEKYCNQIDHSKTKLELNDSLKNNLQNSRIIDDDENNRLKENLSSNRSGQNTPVCVDDAAICDKDNNRYSHLSISSDCTTSTVKKIGSDMESSGHTDDFTSINTDLPKSDSSSMNNDGGGCDDYLGQEKSHLSTGSPKTMKNITPTEKSLKATPVIAVQSLNSGCKDDVESNTTSSDIEPLSCATSTNGDNGNVINNHIPSRYFMADYMKHQRSASGSSMSICKLDPGDDSNDPEQFLSNQHFLSQIAELSKKLDIRESKMIQLSRENIDLRDTINNLTRQIENINERQETDITDINILTKEFTTRLSDAEKRYQLCNKEREQLKKYVVELKNTESQQIEKVIKDKEEQVASLLLEGEKLAQDQLKANNTIKKLRTTIKEYENEINVQTQKIMKFESEVSHLKKVLDSHEENERKHIEGINQLTKAVEKLEKENSQLINSKEINKDRNRTLETVLDKSNQELVKLRKKIIELESEKVLIENNHKSLINQQADKTDVIAGIQSNLEQSTKEINLLQKKIQNQARDFSYKEDEYNSRIVYLQDRVAQMELRQEELTEGASDATKPILRQLESLQSNCAMHTANWERHESCLNTKLNDLQQKLAIIEETAQTYEEQLKSRDIIVNSLREEKNRLLNQYNQEYNGKQFLIDEKIILEQKNDELNVSINKEKENHSKEIFNLEYKVEEIQRKLETEKINSSNLSAKLTNLQLMLDTKQDQKTIKNGSSSSSTIAEVEPDDSVSMVSNTSFDNIEKKTIKNTPSISIYDHMKQQGIAVMMEHLEMSLKQKDGQINKLHRELDNMSRSRESMVEEMTAMTQTIENLESKLDTQQSLIDNVSGLNDRYNALLQMYGEKIEECQELRMDIAEMKDVYRSHIDMLSRSNEML